MRTLPRRLLLSLALAATTTVAAAQVPAPSVAPAAGALTGPQVRAMLEAKGYTRVNDVEFDDGTWTADARSADGNRVEVRIDPATGEIFPDEIVGTLSRDDIRARLSAAGYTNVHDVDWDDGVWKAEVDDANGDDIEVRLDPNSGRILGAEDD